MPKLVDHDKRRVEIAHATWAAVTNVGVERLRLRDIAAEVGFTTGIFAHYFADKDSVLRYSFDLAYEQIGDSIQQSNANETSALKCLENALLALVPDVERPDSVAFIAMCFGIRNSNDPILADAYKKTRDDYRRLLKRILRDAINDGAITTHCKSNEVLDLALAVLDGVCVAALLNPGGYPRSRGQRVIKTLITQISSRAG